MKNTFKITIRTPEAEVFSGEVDSAYLTTETGDMMFLSDHAAFSGTIIHSPVILKSADQENDFVVQRGLAFFSNTKNEASILAYSAKAKEEINPADIKQYLKFIEEKLAAGEDMNDFQIKFLEGEKLALVQQVEELS